MKTFILAGCGLLLLGLAVIGLLLPVWPTTPFVLLAAGCFSGAPRLRAKIMKISFFREYLESYQQKCGLKPQTVRNSLCSLWGMLLLSALMIRRPWVLLLALVGIAVTIHILHLARDRRLKESRP